MRLKMVHVALAGADPSARRRDADLRQKEFLQIGTARSTAQPGSALAAVARLNRRKKTNAPLLPGVGGRPDYFKPK